MIQTEHNVNLYIYHCSRAMDKEKKKEKKNLKAKMRDSSVVIQKATMKKMSESTCKQRIVLDMSFNDLMSDKVIVPLYTFKILVLYNNIILIILFSFIRIYLSVAVKY